MGFVFNGRFTLRVRLRYAPFLPTASGTADGEIDLLKQFFQAVSEILHDATDGAHSIGTVLIAPGDSGSPLDSDIQIFPGAWTHATEENIWTSGGRIEYPRDELRIPTMLAHELGHYLYGLFDENVGSDGSVSYICVNDTLNCVACLMEYYDDAKKRQWKPTGGGGFRNFNDFKSQWQNGTAVLTPTGEPSEFCDDTNHTARDPTISGDPHAHDQNVENADKSCWSTIADDSDRGAFEYKLTAPAQALAASPASAPAPTDLVVLLPTQRTVLVLDRSASMTGAKLDQLKDGAALWTQVVESPEEFGIVSYASTPHVDLLVSEVPVSGSDAAWRAAGLAAVNSLAAGGSTAIGDALVTGLSEITAGGSAAGQVLVLVSDGKQNAGTVDALDVVPQLMAAGVRVFALGVGGDQDAELLAAIADSTDGLFLGIPGDLSHEMMEEMITDLVIALAG